MDKQNKRDSTDFRPSTKSKKRRLGPEDQPFWKLNDGSDWDRNRWLLTQYIRMDEDNNRLLPGKQG